MTIGEIARAAGVRASAIRYYETVGVLPKPQRQNGIRVYDRATVDRVRVLTFYRRAGVSIRSLAAMADGGGGSWRDAVTTRLNELDECIAEAKRMKSALKRALACRCNGNPRHCTILNAAP